MDAYDYIVEEYKPLVYKIAASFNGIEKDDLFQAGVQGLIQAFNLYDESFDTKFSTYAYPFIYGQMYNLVYKNSDLKITKETLTLAKQITKTYHLLSQINQKTPSLSEIASALNKDESLLQAVLMATQKSLSLDYKNDGERSIIETIPVSEPLSLEDKIFLQESLESLPQIEKQIIKERYYHDLTQSEVAKKMGISQVKVSRYEKKGIEKMRVYAKDCA